MRERETRGEQNCRWIEYYCGVQLSDAEREVICGILDGPGELRKYLARLYNCGPERLQMLHDAQP
jgi:hypothetical protein